MAVAPSPSHMPGMALAQPDLFSPEPAAGPDGFAYAPDIVSPAEEAALAVAFEAMPFKPFQFRGYEGNRRTVSFGRRYDHDDHRLLEAEPMPDLLVPLRHAAADFAGLSPEVLAHAMVTEYAPGAGIGWHRDRPEFGVVIGVSLLTPCPLRFRREDGPDWERMSRVLEPRSIYRLDGPARSDWAHSIPPLDRLRYSVTFRTMR